MPGRREYRVEELADLAGITVRTLRFYRERKLLPPPRREGRIAWYDDRHLTRLRAITALLERGHTLSGIAELSEAFEHGRDVRDLLGLDRPTEETPVQLSAGELADMFGGRFSAEDFAAALDLGYLGIDGEHGDRLVHVSRRLVEISARLVGEGVPLSAVLAAGKVVREHTDALARLFVDLVLTHAAPTDLERLRPLAKSVVEAELSLALDRTMNSTNPANTAANTANSANTREPETPSGDPRDRA
ncbi:MerR family transcriptional regulator [Streptomyces sp. NPDC050560]|uniref:MerR family transcriptional regulator n=1 Tax=Streptomyces sp. NPDC050560 TaxID=3365630 RepID=UPI0037AFF4BA